MAKCILTVDDSASVRAVERLVLTKAGYDVVQATDGKEAIAILETTNVSLVFTDLNMPNLNGFELVRWVRQSPKHRLLPIITVTTESDEAKKREGKSLGATGWLVKPFTPDQLIAITKRMIG